MTEKQETISVNVRIRPLLSEEEEGDILSWDHDGINIWSMYKLESRFEVDKVFGPSDSTYVIYDEKLKELVIRVVDGINATIFAYGQTSSGKTYTMKGNEENPGVIPLAIEDVFKWINKNEEREYLCRVSYLEIYNEDIIDLLSDIKENLEICENKDGDVFVAGLKEKIVQDASQALCYLEKGEKKRHIASTKMNEYSSQSHTIFRMIVESKNKNEDEENDKKVLRVSTLTLVDLAGSERIPKTNAKGLKMREGIAVNKSLLTLGMVINQLSNSSPIISYRDSNLTRILKPSLDGNTKTTILCNITPAVSHHDESTNTLRFGCRAKKIVTNAHVNEVISDSTLIKREVKENEKLKKQLLESGNTIDISTKINKLRTKLLESDREKELFKDKFREEKGKAGKQIKLISKLVKDPIKQNDNVSELNQKRVTWCPNIRENITKNNKGNKRFTMDTLCEINLFDDLNDFDKEMELEEVPRSPPHKKLLSNDGVVQKHNMKSYDLTYSPSSKSSIGDILNKNRHENRNVSDKLLSRQLGPLNQKDVMATGMPSEKDKNQIEKIKMKPVMSFYKSEGEVTQKQLMMTYGAKREYKNKLNNIINEKKELENKMEGMERGKSMKSRSVMTDKCGGDVHLKEEIKMLRIKHKTELANIRREEKDKEALLKKDIENYRNLIHNYEIKQNELLKDINDLSDEKKALLSSIKALENKNVTLQKELNKDSNINTKTQEIFDNELSKYQNIEKIIEDLRKINLENCIKINSLESECMILKNQNTSLERQRNESSINISDLKNSINDSHIALDLEKTKHSQNDLTNETLRETNIKKKNTIEEWYSEIEELEMDSNELNVEIEINENERLKKENEKLKKENENLKFDLNSAIVDFKNANDKSMTDCHITIEELKKELKENKEIISSMTKENEEYQKKAEVMIKELRSKLGGKVGSNDKERNEIIDQMKALIIKSKIEYERKIDILEKEKESLIKKMNAISNKNMMMQEQNEKQYQNEDTEKDEIDINEIHNYDDDDDEMINESKEEKLLKEVHSQNCEIIKMGGMIKSLNNENEMLKKEITRQNKLREEIDENYKKIASQTQISQIELEALKNKIKMNEGNNAWLKELSKSVWKLNYELYKINIDFEDGIHIPTKLKINEESENEINELKEEVARHKRDYLELKAVIRVLKEDSKYIMSSEQFEINCDAIKKDYKLVYLAKKVEILKKNMVNDAKTIKESDKIIRELKKQIHPELTDIDFDLLPPGYSNSFSE